MARIKSHGRSSRRYKQLRKDFKAHCASIKAPCWLCGMEIDYRIQWPEDDAFELDHLYPVSTHPDHAEDPAGFRPSHKACNRKRGNKMPTGGLGKPSRTWLKINFHKLKNNKTNQGAFQSQKYFGTAPSWAALGLSLRDFYPGSRTR